MDDWDTYVSFEGPVFTGGGWCPSILQGNYDTPSSVSLLHLSFQSFYLPSSYNNEDGPFILFKQRSRGNRVFPIASPTTEFQFEKINFSKVTKQGFLLNADNRSLSHQEHYVHTKSRFTNTALCQHSKTLRTHLRLVTRLRVSGNIPLHTLYAFMAWIGTTLPFYKTLRTYDTRAFYLPSSILPFFRESNGDIKKHKQKELTACQKTYLVNYLQWLMIAFGQPQPETS
jgi:hypothetical protein